MDKEEKLAHAKLFYPAGTIYYYRINNYNATVGKDADFAVYTDMITDGCGGAVWCENVWAEIIKHPEGYVSPEPVVIHNFPLY